MCVPCAKQVICGGVSLDAAGQILDSQADQWEAEGKVSHNQAQEMRSYAATLVAVGSSMGKLGEQIGENAGATA